jgi:hypothetical protein
MIHDHDIKAGGAFRLRLVPAAGRKLSRIAHKGLKLDPHKALPVIPCPASALKKPSVPSARGG